MVEVGQIHIIHDLDRGIIVEISTHDNSKYDGLEGEGETLHEALSQLLENVEVASDEFQ